MLGCTHLQYRIHFDGLCRRSASFRVAEILLVPFPHAKRTAADTCDDWNVSSWVHVWKDEFQMKRNDENIKAVVNLLQKLAARGTLEMGQAEELKKSLSELRRARRSQKPAKIWAAVDRVARVFLRTLNP